MTNKAEMNTAMQLGSMSVPTNFFSLAFIVTRQATCFMGSLQNILKVSIFVSVKTLDGKSPVQGHSATERWSVD